jgi:excisionase family DNA binding protein
MATSPAATEDINGADTVAVTVTTAEAAVMAGVSQRTIRRWIQRGYLPAESDVDGHRVSPSDLSGAKDAATGGHDRMSQADTSAGHGHVRSGHEVTTDDRTVAVTHLQLQIEGRYLTTIESLRHDYELQLGIVRETFEGWLAEKDQVIAAKDETITELRRRAEATESRLSALEAQLAESRTQPSSAPQTATDAATDVPWWAFWKR